MHDNSFLLRDPKRPTGLYSCTAKAVLLGRKARVARSPSNARCSARASLLSSASACAMKNMSSGCVGGDGEEGEWRERRERGGRCQRAPTPRTRTRTRSHTPHTGEREQRRGCHPVSRVSEQARRGGRAGAPCLSSWRPRAAAPPESAHSGPDSAPQAAPGSRPSRPPTLCWGDGERLGKERRQ